MPSSLESKLLFGLGLFPPKNLNYNLIKDKGVKNCYQSDAM